mgnify:CR=1 FL=1
MKKLINTNNYYKPKQLKLPLEKVRYLDKINKPLWIRQVLVPGITDKEEDFNKKNIVDYNGIKIGMLNYTYGLNGFVLPNDKQYLTDTLYDEEKIKINIEELKKECDFVIVFPHWGTEYTHKETSYQTCLCTAP